jgi:hypothetical protein
MPHDLTERELAGQDGYGNYRNNNGLRIHLVMTGEQQKDAWMLTTVDP